LFVIAMRHPVVERSRWEPVVEGLTGQTERTGIADR
jgi:hypothetical protein